ncbi:MAG: hypothetical protein KDA21_02025, partial [Phycisphaerales bacterium]|nr:hypothetical protein [Phycisphaerales bacterium]
MNTSTTVRAGGTKRQRAAALFPQGDTWQLVVAEGNGHTRVVATQSLPAGSLDSLASVLASHRVERLVRVVPASHCIARLVDIDAGEESDAVAALALQAEVQLPSSLPDHRRSWGMTRAPVAGGGRAGLVSGWVEAADNTDVMPVDTVWTSEVVALALAL